MAAGGTGVSPASLRFWARYLRATTATIAAIATSRSQRIPRMKLSPIYRAMLAAAEHPRHTMQPIRILVTGGTFDKEYNELTGELSFQQTHTGDMLKLGRCLAPVEVETLMMIDSLQMTDAHRALILQRCRAVAET